MAHILFTAINYWPELAGNAPYTTALAEHLVQAGHRVSVITGVPHYPSWHVPPAYRRGLTRREEIRGVEVIRKRHLVPPRQTLWGRALYEATFLLNGLTARLDRPDLIIGVVPSLGGATMARVFARRWGIPYAVIVQDLMGRAASETGIKGGRKVAGMIARAEGWSLRKAQLVAVVSEAFCPYLRGIGVPQDRIVHLPNWVLARSTEGFTEGDRAQTRRRLGWGDDQQIVLHAGNMGLKQHLEQVIAAANVAQRSAPHVRFVLLGNGNQRSKLEREAAGLPNLSFMGTQSETDYDLALHAADILLVSERATVADMSLPSKLTAYCAAGRPIVGAVRAYGATYDEITRSGAGLLVEADCPEQLLEEIDRLYRDPYLSHRLAEAGLSYASESLASAAALDRGEELVDRLLNGGSRAKATS
jgi:glycosyltransferase involved in cell wall biosynthesis